MRRESFGGKICGASGNRGTRRVSANVVGGASANDTRHPFAEHPIQFVDEQIDRGIRVRRRDRGREIRPCDLDSPFRGENASAPPEVAFDIDPKAKNARFVAEEPFRFGLQRDFHRLREPEMNAPYDERGTTFGHSF